MSKLEEILGKEGEIGIELEQNERKKFLRWAKANGMKWFSGREIKKSEECYFHMSIGKDKTIGNISAMCWVVGSRPVCRMTFAEFLKTIDVV